MNIQINDNTLTFFLKGRIDSMNSHEVEEEVMKTLQENSGKKPLFDMAELDYISSAGLRVVLLAHKLMIGVFGNFIVKNPSPFCCQVFEATGMDGALNIEK